MLFEWDEVKNRRNHQKHCIRSEPAKLVFDDPYAITLRDCAIDDEERWITIGAIGHGSVLLIVHTAFERNNEEVIRIISARAARAHEKRTYEEAYKGSERGHKGHHSTKRRR